MEILSDWQRILFNDLPYEFLIEIAFRCFVMFTAALITLRLTGKRGIKQLSVFELVIIISLGSAAGDPMFYEDVGLIPALAVFIFVLLFYRLLTWLSSKSEKFETFVEGKPIYIVEYGQICFNNFKREDLSTEELFMELRNQSVSHLGQVKLAILEPSGILSIYFYKPEEVKTGLCILPREYSNKLENITAAGEYGCTCCGYIVRTEPVSKLMCPNCKTYKWAVTSDEQRSQ
ncbi:protein of unknown function DUF421 [Pseudopedobacter saltans DSM 12145]|uniref:YetF C-terminal domain-containing protein n=1 Tax=Pseudopedobacter saltans (strain ATCC 51119 / DSM 12145 / JCM 21818 / CCUG 39354 / LMG 10337 / NBRC 100064 / NCIMB 13643) TaxID=762903 RepID=F0SDI4_PSESL|nr:DUF421 domain-containing protein [Pseudopedobacter saltans]ADY53967.1 protein of unknown function DUF421 [Pseudopedobacter saltans DSM 12145]